MNSINDQKFFIIAQLSNALRGTALRTRQDRKMPPEQKEELLKFMKGLEKYIIEYEPDLTKNEAFFKERKEDGSR